MLKKFFFQTKNPEKSGAFWNMTASVLSAFQSVIMLMVLLRVTDQKTAGIFTIGNAEANLMLTIGRYGMRQYQASDVRGRYRFQTYLVSRWITSAAMLLGSVLYVWFLSVRGDYSDRKFWIVLVMCLYKIPDAVEDVYAGEYQRRRRLDVGSKMTALRMALTILFFLILIIVSRDLLLTAAATAGFTTLFLLLSIRQVASFSGVPEKFTDPDIPGKEEENRSYQTGHLLWETFPLMLSAFLQLYINTAPKNAIDRYLPEDIQAIYGYLSMPVFVVTLLSGFVFNPLLYQMSVRWERGEYRRFHSLLRKQVLYVTGVSILCLAGGACIGTPVLSWLYAVDLRPFRKSLVLLLLGGGFMGLSGLMSGVLTIFRQQKLILTGYALSALAAGVGSGWAVRKGGMEGAVLIYLLVLGFLMLFFVGTAETFLLIQQKKRKTHADTGCNPERL